MIIIRDNAEEDAEIIEVPLAVEMQATLVTGMIIKIGEPATVKDNGTFMIIEGTDKTLHIKVNEDSGTVMTQITVTGTLGTKIPMVKVILTGVEDGIIIKGVKDIVIAEEEEDGTPISNIKTQGINRNTNFQIQIIIIHHQWDIKTDTHSHMVNTHTPNNNNIINHIDLQPHLNKLQIFVSCVIVKAITTINANLQVISWPACKCLQSRQII